MTRSIITASISLLLPLMATAQAPIVPSPVAVPDVTVPVTAPSPAPSPVSIDLKLPAVPQSPEVAMPTAAGPLGEMSAAVQESAAAAEPFSYGTFPDSIMFSPSQINSMKSALTIYETLRRRGGTAEINIEEQVVPMEQLQEPASYPVFTLGSIAYRAADDWTVWIAGGRITPRTNDQQLKVIALSPEAARFAWQPTYMQALTRRNELAKFASSDGVKHKATNPNTATVDSEHQQVIFTLKPNQSFSAGYMATFEGKVAPPPLEPLQPPPPPAGTAPGATTPAAVNADAPELQSDGLAQDAVRRLYDQGARDLHPDGENTQPEQTADELNKKEQYFENITPNTDKP